MNTLIAYFTGTGNSLFIAKELSKNGIVVYLVNGKNKNVILDLIEGKETGTKFLN